jgi:quinolinate synthase
MFTAETLFERLKNVRTGLCAYSHERCQSLVPVVNEILSLKKQKNAVILAHSYVSPDIIYTVADFTGDSYGLSKDAARTQADTIVFAAVKFMGETAKILNPGKEVLIPNELNGCTLADAVTGDDVRCLKKNHPDHTFVCYINTTAEVKAECDVCVTSSNVYKIVEAIPNDKIYFLPDKLMGKNLQNAMKQRGVKKEILLYEGTCYVHEEYRAENIPPLRRQYPAVKVLSHPECSPEVVAHSDYVGSTTQMIDYVKQSKDTTFFMLTECGLISRLQVEMPDKKFVGTCSLCRYMKSNTLEDIRRVLKNPRPQDRIAIDESVRRKALHCIEEMFRYTEMAVALKG